MTIDLVVKNYRCFEDTSPLRFALRPGITGILGTNNSGKSTILKLFYEFRSLFNILRGPTGNLIDALQGNGQPFDRAASIYDLQELFSSRNDSDIEIEFEVLGSPPAPRPADSTLRRLTITIHRPRNVWTARMRLANHDDVEGNQIGSWDGTALKIASGTRDVDLAEVFQTCRLLTQTLYIGPFRNAINSGTQDSYFDIRCGQSFIHEWRNLKHGDVLSQSRAIRRVTEDIRHIFEYTTLDIDTSADERTLDIETEVRRFKLPEVGSGITQFILVLGNAAINSPQLILIDEPELNLHPTLQLDFLTTLASYASYGLVFSTHSYGLARSASDQIFTARLVEPGKSEVRPFENTQRLSEILGELNFSGYQDLGFDRILLVEGRHDVKAVQQLLRKYGKDHQVVLLPLGGAAMITPAAEEELVEVLRISNNVSALIDSERDNAGAALEASRDVFRQVCARLGINCHVTVRRALEHYLTDRAVKAVKGEKYRALEPYEKRETVQPIWGKEENWQIAREMNREEVTMTDLGDFIQGL